MCVRGTPASLRHRSAIASIRGRSTAHSVGEKLAPTVIGAIEESLQGG
ncbi:hypothetical protein SMICM304S_08847 [Streptomyces microflavus]